jgi:uncharacterized phage protein (TIGR02218 family)
MFLKNLVTCIRMQLPNDIVYCFCDNEDDFYFEKEKYISSLSFTVGQLNKSSQLGDDNFKIKFAIDGKFFEKSKLIANHYSAAFVEVFLIDLLEDVKRKKLVNSGWVGAVSIKENHFTTEINCLSSKLNCIINQSYSSNCRAKLGDARCKIDKSNFSFKGIVGDIIEENVFLDQSINKENGYYNYGEIKFLNGELESRVFLVKENIDQKIYIQAFEKLNIKVGDQYELIAGCNKSIQTCIAKFNNAINFRGEPFIPNKYQLVI